jgi:hypothetical protein
MPVVYPAQSFGTNALETPRWKSCRAGTDRSAGQRKSPASQKEVAVRRGYRGEEISSLAEAGIDPHLRRRSEHHF